MIFKEFFDQPYDAMGTDFGYVVVEIHGSMAQATYKAEKVGPDLPGSPGLPAGPYVPQDSWAWKFFAAAEEE